RRARVRWRFRLGCGLTIVGRYHQYIILTVRKGWRMQVSASVRRDAVAFVLRAALPALAVSALFAIHPWPTALPAQAATLGFVLTAPYLAAGLLGAALARQVGCGRTEGSWTRAAAWALAAGVACGAFDLALVAFTPWGGRLHEIER